MKMDVFWVVVPYSLISCLLSQSGLMMEAASTSEAPVNFYQAMWRYNPEDGHLYVVTCVAEKYYLKNTHYLF
jgi:hypothetical protein